MLQAFKATLSSLSLHLHSLSKLTVRPESPWYSVKVLVTSRCCCCRLIPWVWGLQELNALTAWRYSSSLQWHTLPWENGISGPKSRWAWESLAMGSRDSWISLLFHSLCGDSSGSFNCPTSQLSTHPPPEFICASRAPKGIQVKLLYLVLCHLAPIYGCSNLTLNELALNQVVLYSAFATLLWQTAWA